MVHGLRTVAGGQWPYPVVEVRLSRIPIDLRDEDALPSGVPKGDVEAADPREQVSEGEHGGWHAESLELVFELVKLPGGLSPGVSRIVVRLQLGAANLPAENDPPPTRRVPPCLEPGLG